MQDTNGKLLLCDAVITRLLDKTYFLRNQAPVLSIQTVEVSCTCSQRLLEMLNGAIIIGIHKSMWIFFSG